VDFIGDATSSQLLILMSLPLMGAVILTVFLIVSFRRRTRNRQKGQMRLGTQPTEEVPAVPTADEVLSIDSADDLSPSAEPSSTPSIVAPQTPPAEVGFNLDVLSNQVEMEAFSMDTPKSSPEDKVDLAARLGNQPPRATPASEPAELLRLLRHPQTGDLIVEVAGNRYTKLADVDDKEIGQYLLELIGHLLVFSNGMIATRAGVKSVYLPKVGETPLPLTKPTPISELPDPAAFGPSPPSEKPEPTPSESELVPPPPPEAEAAFRASLQGRSSQEPPQPQRGGLFGRPKPKSEAAVPSSFNLAEEINQIVQTRLMVSPLSATTDIEIVSDPSGGIQIKVDGISYASPDDISDPEVRTLIKESIKQWERS
jgi:hypothetical protein